MTNCTDWNYIDVRDFEILRQIYQDKVACFEKDEDSLIESIKEMGVKLNQEMGLNYPYLDEKQSKYTYDLYRETIELTRTYYREV
jgi:hypothetical protein